MTTSASSVWPLPCTPATPRISPLRTSSPTCARSGAPVGERSETSSSARPTSPGAAGSFSTRSMTGRPTIIVASSSRLESAEACPTTLPRRMTVISSATAWTSRSLWVMKTMEVPAAASSFMTCMSSSVSCGVSTAVGSSRTRIFAPLERALTISTCCWTPTGRSSTRASGSMSNPNLADVSSTRALARARSMSPAARVGSYPRHTDSATVKTGTSMKCWCTMPMPAATASAAEWNLTGSPSRRISPASAS